MKQNTLGAGYLSSFCLELYLTLQAGIPIAEGVGILLDGEDDSRLKAVLSAVYTDLRGGGALHAAMARSGAFPAYLVDMVRVGEQTGNLDTALGALSNYYDRQEQLAGSIRNAVLYPAVLLAMMLAVVVILIVKVLPIFQDVFAQLGGTMTGTAAGVLRFGALLREHWLLAVAVLAVVIVALAVFAALGRRRGERVLLSKKLGLDVASAKLASVLAMSLHSGLDLDQALEMAASMTEHPALREKLRRCRDRMRGGESFVSAMAGETVFPGLYCRMLAVGVKTGTVDTVMEAVARRISSAAEDAIDRRIGSVEPALVIVMSVLVGLVLLAVMLPLAGILSSLG